MPPCLPQATVLVTGANGFIGTWICQTLLQSGYFIRGTGRSQYKGNHLKKLFATFGEKFEYVVVEDPTKVDAFKEAVQGNVSAVIHLAAPVSFDADRMDEFKAQMVGATENLLDAIRKNNTTVKRFIYVSSAQALLGKSLEHIYTEDDWNDAAVAAVTNNFAETDGATRYQAGKVMSERLVLGYPEQHGGANLLGWDTVTLIPVWTFGPLIQEFTSLDDINFSTRIFYKHMTEPRETSRLNDYGSDYVDVRDVCEALVATLQDDKAGGERFILDAGVYTFQNLYDAVRGESAVQTGDPDAPKFSFPRPFCSSEKAIKTLGISFRSLETTAKDTLSSLRKKGI